MKLLIVIITIALTGVAQADRLPAINYSCKSIATFIVDGEYNTVDTKEQIIGYVLTPNTQYQYMNVGIVQFVHTFRNYTLYTAAQSSIASYIYEPEVSYSQANYYHLSSSITDPNFEIKTTSGFETPSTELPKNFVIRLGDYIELDEYVGVLTRLECNFREQVDPR